MVPSRTLLRNTGSLYPVKYLLALPSTPSIGGLSFLSHFPRTVSASSAVSQGTRQSELPYFLEGIGRHGHRRAPEYKTAVLNLWVPYQTFALQFITATRQFYSWEGGVTTT